MMPLAGRRFESLPARPSSAHSTSMSRKCDSPLASVYRLWIFISGPPRGGDQQENGMDYSRTNLQGKTAFITGASRNIGRAIALAFAAQGADLVLNTRTNRDELEAVADECRKAGVRAVPVLGDIGETAAVEAMVRTGLAELGAIDVLVCNAAIRPHKSLADTSLEDWHQVMAVNLHSAFYLARAVVPGMKERKRGSIIALGGQSSITGRPNTAAVTAAKSGLLGLVRALAAELGAFVILASDASAYVTGDTIRVMGGRIIG